MGCISTSFVDSKDIVRKFRPEFLTSIATSEPEFPRLVCGKIIAGSLLSAPFSGRPCVYFKAVAEEYDEHEFSH